MSSPTVSFQSVTRRFGKRVALDGISLDVPEGSVLGLVGRNGAGKTTALRLAMGILHPDAGTLRVLGLDPVRQGLEVRRRLSLISEEAALYPDFRIRELMRLTRGLHPRWDDAVARDLVERLGLDPGQRVRELSRGTRAKVSLLLAVATRPEVLLLDDPTAGLDPLVRREVLESIVESFPEQGGAVVYASHLIHDIERVADRVAVLDEGHVVLEGSVDDLRSRYARASAVFENDPPASFDGVHVLEREARGRSLSVVSDAPPEALARALREAGAKDVDIARLDLEDLLIALLREGEWEAHR